MAKRINEKINEKKTKKNEIKFTTTSTTGTTAAAGAATKQQPIDNEWNTSTQKQHIFERKRKWKLKKKQKNMMKKL